MRMWCIARRAAPHPAFGHLLPAARGEGEQAPRLLHLFLLPATRGEGGAQRRMRGGFSHCARRKPLFTQHQSSVASISVALTFHIKMLLKPDKNLANPIRFAKLGEGIAQRLIAQPQQWR